MFESEVTDALSVHNGAIGKDRFVPGNAFENFSAAASNDDNVPTLDAQCFEQCSQALETKCALLLRFDNNNNNNKNPSTTSITEPKTNKDLQRVFNPFCARSVVAAIMQLFHLCIISPKSLFNSKNLNNRNRKYIYI